jgi:hypothetical protein
MEDRKWGWPKLRLLNLKDRVDHDRCSDGRAIHTVDDPNVSSLDAEKLDKEVRGAIGDHGMINEFLRRRKEDECFTSFLFLSY